ncbi:TRAP-type mannitol/chloroaromatic compound transport system substrate-binding protein, partial [Roseovarius sp. MBR-51]
MTLNRRALFAGGFGAAAAALASKTALAQGGEVYTLSYQSSHPSNQAFTTITGGGFREIVEELSNGRIKFETYDTGALSSVTGMLEAVDQGIIDVSQSYGAFYSGDVPEADVEVGLPFAWKRPWEAYDAYYNRGLREVISGAYETKFNVKHFPAILGMNYGVALRDEISSISDLAGKKIRAVGVYGEYVQQLGASPVVIPGAELYTAMQLGTIDGVLYAAEA